MAVTADASTYGHRIIGDQQWFLLVCSTQVQTWAVRCAAVFFRWTVLCRFVAATMPAHTHYASECELNICICVMRSCASLCILHGATNRDTNRRSMEWVRWLMCITLMRRRRKQSIKIANAHSMRSLSAAIPSRRMEQKHTRTHNTHSQRQARVRKVIDITSSRMEICQCGYDMFTIGDDDGD